MITNQIAVRLRVLRSRKNVTGETVCRALGLNNSAVSVYERGKAKIPVDKLERLANYYGVPMEYFFVSEAKADAILTGQEVKEKEDRAQNEQIEKLTKELSEAKFEAVSAMAVNDRLNKQIKLMETELEHYRAQTVSTPAEWTTLKETTLKALVASRAMLNAAAEIMEQSYETPIGAENDRTR